MKKMMAVFACGLVVGATGIANANSLLTSTLNTDDSYQIYISTSDSVQGVSFGSGTGWSNTFTDTTTLVSGTNYYLHVVGVNVAGPAGFLGQFALSAGDFTFINSTTALLTNTTNWQGNLTGFGTAYTPLNNIGPNDGSAVWGNIPSIASTADWIWGGTVEDGGTSYFSTEILYKGAAEQSVPEPVTMLLLGTGLVGLAASRKKK